MDKYLIVKGCAGLGNRLYTISNAIHYAQKTNRILVVDWSDGQFCEFSKNAFHLYFELNNIKHLKNISDISTIENRSVYPSCWEKKLHTNLYENYEHKTLNLFNWLPSKLNKYIPKLSMRAGYFKSKQNLEKPELFSFLSKQNFILGQYLNYNIQKSIVVFVDFSPPFFEEILRTNIKLKPNLVTKIDSFVKKHELANKGIGVHIRYTDKKPNATFSNLYDKIDALNSDEKVIFLSTDNLAIQKIFIEKYPNTIVTEKYLPENQEEGLHQWALYNKKEDQKTKLFEESIVDMWVLSRCKNLIYQENSSFSQLSRILKSDKNCTSW